MLDKDMILEFHKQHTVVDAHCDSISSYVSGKRNLAKMSTNGQIDLPRLRQGGVTVQFFASFVEPEFQGGNAVLRALELVNGTLRLIEHNPEQAMLLTCPTDIQSALDTKRTAILISIEGGSALGGRLFMLDVYYQLGVRAIGLTWNYANELAGGVLEPARLTPLGAQVVNGMNRLGMLVDVSHLSEAAFWDVLEISKSPVIASHSCCRVLCKHPRNLTDEQIKAIAASGGVIGINFYSQFLKGPHASISDVIDHIEHVCAVAGSDHVGIGSDYDGCESLPKGLEDATCLPALTEELFARGYCKDDVAKIIGGNFERVIGQVLK